MDICRVSGFLMQKNKKMNQSITGGVYRVKRLKKRMEVRLWRRGEIERCIDEFGADVYRFCLKLCMNREGCGRSVPADVPEGIGVQLNFGMGEKSPCFFLCRGAQPVEEQQEESSDSADIVLPL